VVDSVTGEYVPVKDFGLRTSTLGLDQYKINAVQVDKFMPQGVKPVYEVTTRRGLKIKATSSHPFLCFTGWMPLSELQVGDKIATAKSIPVWGKTPLPDWEAILLGLMISEGQCHTENHSPTYTSTDKVMIELLEDCVKDGWDGRITYRGRFGYRLVNRVGRGGYVTHNKANRWLKSYGLDVIAIHKFVPQVIFAAPKETVTLFLRALFTGDGSVQRKESRTRVEYYTSSRRLAEDVQHLLSRFGIISTIRSKVSASKRIAYTLGIYDQNHVIKFFEEIGFWPASVKQLKWENEFKLQTEKNLNAHVKTEVIPHQVWTIIRNKAYAQGRSLNSIGANPDFSCSPTVQVVQTIADRLQDGDLSAIANSDILWDIVESIEYAGEEEVYDLSVPSVRNFIANNIIVHNSTYARCGIITNVTPFEPGWEGYVTLEISNTTPLPAKIYAGEGIAQVLFFEADEPCEVSYADRKGKYQGQTGIVLPKV
jgi:intein/homing endonuclease